MQENKNEKDKCFSLLSWKQFIMKTFIGFVTSEQGEFQVGNN